MDRIFYRTEAYDHGRPVYIFDTSFLPSPDIINYDELIITLMSLAPKENYSLIMFCSGLNRISWIWGVKFLKKFLIDETNLHNIHRIISVHEGWFIKSLTSILKNYHLTKQNFNILNKLLENFKLDGIQSIHGFGDSNIINCNSLSQLNQLFDITKLKISLNIYKVDYQLNNPPIPISPDMNNEVINYHIYQIFNILNTNGDKIELLFHKPGSKIGSEILLDCIKRDQLIFVNDWNLHCIATTFKKLLSELPVTFIPINLIHLPLSDDTIEANFMELIHNLSSDNSIILINLFNLLEMLINNGQVTKLNSKILSKIFINCLSHQVYLKTNEPNLIIVNNFIKKIIENWASFDNSMKAIDMSEIFNSTYTEENSYIDYDLTIDSDFDDETCHSEQVQHDLQTYEYEQDISLSPKKVLTSNNNVLNSMKSINSISSMNSVSSIDSISTLTPQSPMKSPMKSPIKPPKSLEPPQSSNISVQFPPQKYKFSSTRNLREVKVDNQLSRAQSTTSLNYKKPVIRGIKVSELARLYEERAQGLELLKSL